MLPFSPPEAGVLRCNLWAPWILVLLVLTAARPTPAPADDVPLQVLSRQPRDWIIRAFGENVLTGEFQILSPGQVAFLVQKGHGASGYRPVVVDLVNHSIHAFIAGVDEVPVGTRLCVGRDGKRYLFIPTWETTAEYVTRLLVRGNSQGQMETRIALPDMGKLDVGSDGTVYVASFVYSSRGEPRYFLRAYTPDGTLRWQALPVPDTTPEISRTRPRPVNVKAVSNGVYVQVERDLYFVDLEGNVRQRIAIPLAADEEFVPRFMPLGADTFLAHVVTRSIRQATPGGWVLTKERVMVFNSRGERWVVAPLPGSGFPMDAAMLAVSRDGHVFWWNETEMSMARVERALIRISRTR